MTINERDLLIGEYVAEKDKGSLTLRRDNVDQWSIELNRPERVGMINGEAQTLFSQFAQELLFRTMGSELRFWLVFTME